jgi:Putative zinc-finger
MRCQDFERLILESDERELLLEERLALEAHLETCSGCSAFQTFRASLRRQLREASGPALSDELSDSIRVRCLAELDSLSRARAGRNSGRPPAGVPWPIWGALLVLTGLTVLFLIPGLEEFRQSQKLTLGTIIALLVILQNAVMLMCTPLLMRRGRLSQIRFRQFS